MARKNLVRAEEKRYIDGYGLDKRKDAVIDKRKNRRFERALKTKNVDALLEDEEEYTFSPTQLKMKEMTDEEE